MNYTTPIYGLMAEFSTPESILAAARKARVEGYRRMDTYTPFQVEGLAEAVGFRFNLLPWLILFGGFGGAAAGYFMLYDASVISYRLNVGGRPLHSWPAFIPITFELGVLGASLTAIFGLLLLCGLPQPYHPVFNAPDFELQSRGRFFLCIEATDRKFDIVKTRQFLRELDPQSVVEVEHWKHGPQVVE